MKLTTVNDRLQIVLGGSVTANQLQCLTSYKIYTASTTSDHRLAVDTNNTTDVDLAGPPGSGEAYDIQNINVYNKDTVAQLVTIKLDVSGAETILYKGNLGPGEVITWTAEGGWKNTTNNVVPVINNRMVLSGALYETVSRSMCDEVINFRVVISSSFCANNYFTCKMTQESIR